MNKYDIKSLERKLEKCKSMSLDDVSLNDVDEIKKRRDTKRRKIDKRKSSNERILDFLNKVKNPYIFKVKGKLVRIRFSDTEKTADDCLTNVLKNLYR